MKQEANKEHTVQVLEDCIQQKGHTIISTSLSIYYHNKSTKYLDGVNICAFGFGSYIASGELQ